MNWIDIVVVLVVAGVVISRFLAYKLPRDERPKAQRKTDLSKLLGRHVPAEPKPESVEEPPSRPKAPVKKVGAKDLAGLEGIEKIKALDPAFDEKKFLDGAKAAYRFFYENFSKRDEAALAELVAPRLLDDIVGGWGKAPKTVKVEKISAVEMGKARVNGRTAFVEAILTAERLEGRAKRKVTSTWLLARALGSDDPNWELQEMKEERA